jgi:hypothetical protein
MVGDGDFEANDGSSEEHEEARLSEPDERPVGVFARPRDGESPSEFGRRVLAALKEANEQVDGDGI